MTPRDTTGPLNAASASNPSHGELVFLHTSAAHVPTFEQIVAGQDRDRATPTPVRHLVREDLLVQARRLGADHPEVIVLTRQAVTEARESGASTVVCTCSTVGGIVEAMDTTTGFRALRIDRAMADRAVALGPRLLVVVALASTLQPTRELLHSSAQAAGLALQPRILQLDEAWPHFEQGKVARYLDSIVAAVRARLGDAQGVVLAQASMAPAATLLADLGVPVLASPSIGVAHALRLHHARHLGAPS